MLLSRRKLDLDFLEGGGFCCFLFGFLGVRGKLCVNFLRFGLFVGFIEGV